MNLRNRGGDSLRDGYEAALIKAGFHLLERRELDELEEWLNSPEGANAGADGAAEQWIGRAVSRQAFKSGLRRAMPVALKAVACILLVFYVGLTVAVATVEQVRVELYEFLIDIQEEYTQLRIRADESAVLSVPAEWEGSYYPAYIPEGLQFVSVDPMGPLPDSSVIFESADKMHWLMFWEYTEGNTVNINTEDTQMEHVNIGGLDVMISTSDSEEFVTWSLSDRFFVIWTDGGCDEIEAIVSGIKFIK